MLCAAYLQQQIVAALRCAQIAEAETLQFDGVAACRGIDHRIHAHVVTEAVGIGPFTAEHGVIRIRTAEDVAACTADVSVQWQRFQLLRRHHTAIAEHDLPNAVGRIGELALHGDLVTAAVQLDQQIAA